MRVTGDHQEHREAMSNEEFDPGRHAIIEALKDAIYVLDDKRGCTGGDDFLFNRYTSSRNMLNDLRKALLKKASKRKPLTP